jgi:UDP-3-O-acyl N-acetylglucosamine deacetylase
MKQKTINKPFTLSGTGLHSSKAVALVFHPGAANGGIIFRHAGRNILAVADNVKDTVRGTSLHGIAVVEHLLGAIYGLGIDNLIINISGNELPSLDGSALPYVEALLASGITEQGAEKTFFPLASPIKVSEGEAFIEAIPFNGFKVDFMINFPGVGEQHLALELSENSFIKEIAPARTFGYLEEVDALKERGLAHGASFENALVLSKDGYINTPRFQDELVRHKILDLLGDLALTGTPIKAAFYALKSGHKLNIALSKKIRSLQQGGSRST